MPNTPITPAQTDEVAKLAEVPGDADGLAGHKETALTVYPQTSDDVLEQFAISYRESTDSLATFLARYPEHTSDLVDYAHELNLVRARDGDDHQELTAEQEIQIEKEVARMSKVRKTPIVLVCTVCHERCSADPVEYERKQVAFCPCGQRALPQDEAYFERRNTAATRSADALAKLAEIPAVGSEELERLSRAATPGQWTSFDGQPSHVFARSDDGRGRWHYVNENERAFLLALVNAWRGGKLMVKP